MRTTAPAASSRPRGGAYADHLPVLQQQGPRRHPPGPVKLAVAGNGVLHRPLIELAIGLRPGPPDRRPLAPVEQPELDPGLVGHAAHQSVERIDLPDEMTLAQSADRRDCRTSRRSYRARWVSSSVRAPARAAAEAASQPAWPPPITITSNVLISRCIWRFSPRPTSRPPDFVSRETKLTSRGKNPERRRRAARPDPPARSAFRSLGDASRKCSAASSGAEVSRASCRCLCAPSPPPSRCRARDSAGSLPAVHRVSRHI